MADSCGPSAPPPAPGASTNTSGRKVMCVKFQKELPGLDEARAVAGIDEIHITAKPDQVLVPLPEGASYLGFIFARAEHAADAECALRAAHARLAFAIDAEFPVLTAAQINYNQRYG